MSLPLSALTFVRMADVSPVGVLISDFLDAIYTALAAVVDYRGTALPATHLHTVNRRRPTVVTEAVDVSFLNGTMTKTPLVAIIAGRIANAGTMASPDTSAASVPQIGIVKQAGAYSDWSSATPWTSGSFFGYWRWGTATGNATTTVVRCYVSQESVFIQVMEPTATNNRWAYLGAIVEPFDVDTTSSGETDNRLYGQITSGNAAVVSASWLSGSGSVMWQHSTVASAVHAGVFTPGGGTLMTMGRQQAYFAAGAAAELQTPSGVYVGDVLQMAKNSATTTPNGSRLGTLRGIYGAGAVQSGRYLRDGSTDKYHFVSTDPTAAADGFMLKAVP